MKPKETIIKPKLSTMASMPKLTQLIEPLSYSAFQSKFHTNSKPEYLVYLTNNNFMHDHSPHANLNDFYQHQTGD